MPITYRIYNRNGMHFSRITNKNHFFVVTNPTKHMSLFDKRVGRLYNYYYRTKQYNEQQTYKRQQKTDIVIERHSDIPNLPIEPKPNIFLLFTVKLQTHNTTTVTDL